MKQLEAEGLQLERVHLGAYVDREVAERLAEVARSHDRSTSAELRRAVAAHVEREKENTT